MGWGVSRNCCRGLSLLEAVPYKPFCCFLLVAFFFRLVSANLIPDSANTSEYDLRFSVSSQDT